MTSQLPKEGLTLSQEKRMLGGVVSDLTLAVFTLGVDGKRKFPKLAKLIEDAIDEAERNAIAADDAINERM